MENNYGTGLYQDGVFYFTNPGKEDWTARWNNKDYLFKAGTTVPLIIANEPPENIQEIRKRFAKRYAQHVLHQQKDFKKKENAQYIPATYDEDTVLAPMIQACLTPLPKSSAVVSAGPVDSEKNYKASKPVSKGANLEKIFEDYTPPELGEQSV